MKLSESQHNSEEFLEQDTGGGKNSEREAQHLELFSHGRQRGRGCVANPKKAAGKLSSTLNSFEITTETKVGAQGLPKFGAGCVNGSYKSTDHWFEPLEGCTLGVRVIWKPDLT